MVQLEQKNRTAVKTYTFTKELFEDITGEEYDYQKYPRGDEEVYYEVFNFLQLMGIIEFVKIEE